MKNCIVQSLKYVFYAFLCFGLVAWLIVITSKPAHGAYYEKYPGLRCKVDHRYHPEDAKPFAVVKCKAVNVPDRTVSWTVRIGETVYAYHHNRQFVYLVLGWNYRTITMDYGASSISVTGRYADGKVQWLKPQGGVREVH